MDLIFIYKFIDLIVSISTKTAIQPHRPPPSPPELSIWNSSVVVWTLSSRGFNIAVALVFWLLAFVRYVYGISRVTYLYTVVMIAVKTVYKIMTIQMVGAFFTCSISCCCYLCCYYYYYYYCYDYFCCGHWLFFIFFIIIIFFHLLNGTKSIMRIYLSKSQVSSIILSSSFMRAQLHIFCKSDRLKWMLLSSFNEKNAWELHRSSNTRINMCIYIKSNYIYIDDGLFIYLFFCFLI